MPPTKWSSARWAVEAVPDAPEAPPASKKKRRPRRSPSRSHGAFLRGETRAEMIRRFESKGVVFAPADLALSTPQLREVGRLRLEDQGASS